MPYSIPVGSHLVIMRYARAGDPEEMLNMVGGNDALSADDVAGLFTTAYVGSLDQQTDPDIVLVAWTVVAGSVSAAPPYQQFEYIVNLPGDSSNYPLVPQNSAVLVHKQRALGEGGRNGRLYWPVLGESFVNDIGVIDPAVLGDLQTAWNTFFNDLVTGGFDPVIFRQVGAADETPALVQSFVVDQLIATQRGRLRR